MTTIIKPYGIKKKVRITFTGKGKTKQSEAESCDINKIIARAQRGIMKDFTKVNQDSYGDMSNAIDFHTSQNIVANAQQKFDELPSNIRSRFDNEPEKFLEFFDDNNNAQEAFDLGLTTFNPKDIREKEKIDEAFTPQTKTPEVVPK